MRHIIQVTRQVPYALDGVPDRRPDAVWLVPGTERPALDRPVHRGNAVFQDTMHDYALNLTTGTIRWHGSGGPDDPKQPVWLVLIYGPDTDAMQFCGTCGQPETARHVCGTR